MKFIFPQNYDFKNKLFGVIDYSTTFVNLLWYAFIFIVVNLIFPLLLFSFVGFNGENILYVFSYLIRFLLKQKLLLYRK